MIDEDGFRLYLMRKGCAPTTIKRRLWNIKNTLKQIELTPQEVDKYLLSLLTSGYKATYINSIVDSIRTYASFKGIDGLQHLKDFKEAPTVRSCMSDEEIESFLALPCPVRHVVSKFGKHFTRKIDEKNYDRQTIFFMICFFTGMRMGEVAKLSLDNIQWGEDIITVNNDKTHHNRVVPIAPNIHDRLKFYCSNLKAHRTSYLFAAHNSSGFINSSTWGDAFQKRCKRLGISRKGLTPYSARHSFIRAMLNEDVDLFKVQRIVGHSRIETTAKYRNLVYKDLISAIKRLPIVSRSDPHIYLDYIRETIRKFNIENDGRFEFIIRETEGELDLHIRVK